METKVCSVVFFLLVVVLSCCQSASVFRFANVFGDHMVLQQAPVRAQVWGYGEVGQEVVVTMAGEMYRTFITSATSAPQNAGMWSVLLVPGIFGGPYIINAYSVVNETKVIALLEDVLFGDVWICSGQSNMEFTVIQSDDAATAINESVHYRNIRLFTADMVTSDVPLSELKGVRQPWSVASPEAVGGPEWKYFSAVCWYYAVQLYDKLKYPIGLVSTTWGGTPIEAWSSPDALAKCTNTTTEQEPIFFTERKHDPKHSARELSLNEDPHNFSCLWNGMVTPFLNMTIYGVIWYQGEENAERPILAYNCTFPAMIDDWRAKWYESTDHNTNEVFPFGFVQLSTAGNSTTGQECNFAPLRWDQTAQFGYVPNTRQKSVFMAVAMDLGNPKSRYDSVHPTDKDDVGQRLARAGLAIGYGVSVYYSGPLLSEIKKQLDSAIEVVFKSVSGEIEVRSTSGFELFCQETDTWIEAPIIDSGPTSVIITPSTPTCVVEAVRYAWSDYPCVIKKCAIYSDDLPSPPFIKYGALNQSTIY